MDVWILLHTSYGPTPSSFAKKTEQNVICFIAKCIYENLILYMYMHICFSYTQAKLIKLLPETFCQFAYRLLHRDTTDKMPSWPENTAMSLIFKHNLCTLGLNQ